MDRELGLDVWKLQSGPLGGDQHVGAMISQGELDLPSSSGIFWSRSPHDRDVKALLWMTVVWNIPVACNRSPADIMIASPLMSGDYARALPAHEEERCARGGCRRR